MSLAAYWRTTGDVIVTRCPAEPPVGSLPLPLPHAAASDIARQAIRIRIRMEFPNSMRRLLPPLTARANPATAALHARNDKTAPRVICYRAVRSFINALAT
jgi:hypothetical protein